VADMRPIPTPIAYRWRRFVQSFLPIVIFLVAIVLTLWLWDRQSQMGNAVGVAEAKYVDVSSGSAGILIGPGHGEWREFQTVKRGEIIGAVRLAQTEFFAAQIATIQKEKDKVRSDLIAAREQFLLQMRRQDDGQWFDVTRLYWRVEELRQDFRDRETRIATAQAELRTLNATVDFSQRSADRGGAISEQEVVENRLRSEERRRTIAQEQKAQEATKLDFRREYKRLKAVRGQFATQSSERWTEIQTVVKAIIGPFQKQLDVLDSRIEEVHAETNSLVIRAPVDGVVATVYAVPGQSVQPGDPVIQIASENSDYIISYVRHRQRVQPVANMAVKLRTRHTGSRPIESSVVEVGPLVQPVPLQHLYDPKRPEWGTQIKIAVPDILRQVIKPGEQIDIIFPSRTEQAPQQPAAPNPEMGV